MAADSAPGRERRRFALLIGVGLLLAAIQFFVLPSKGRTPSLPRGLAEEAYASARETPVEVAIGQLNGGRWEHAQIVYPGDDAAALCPPLAEGRAACEAALAPPLKQPVLLGFKAGRLSHIEQVPANLLQLAGCRRELLSAQKARLLREGGSQPAQLGCLPAARDESR
ncbi:hypothetical protein [Chitinimonas koreensis]|uniref:hypothetical protein n=1 Tax=Chitinimonas koreensis TaxID=356302 RepID=UPI0003F98119|nr:hypothetical protein [Chitinimonas koreensis]QNM96428.1 hypothetical protein H9L41_22020 [Chitinimonas koreensis]